MDMDSTNVSRSDSSSDSESDRNKSSILFFKKAPSDESRLAKNSIIYKKNNLEKGLTKDKRVTVQQVLDKRTYIRLKRLHGRGIFDFIYGVISTGKEANVYEAEGTLLSNKHRIAIKVYKTSILIFKDRSRYIEGEFRFRRSYVGTKNPRKMVSQWAEKEFRNLRRISLSGIYCPSPIALKDHILVMELIQDSDGSVSSKLKDLGTLPLEEWISIYAQVISIMRILYQESKLIHADFSSYNLLYSDSRVIVIDVSQAVENDHPNAMYFLKRDCENITTFFTTIQYHVNNTHYDSLLNEVHNHSFNDISTNADTHSSDHISQESDTRLLGDIHCKMPSSLYEDVNHNNGEHTINAKNIDGCHEDTQFNMLTSFQLFSFITMDMDEIMEMEIESLMNTDEVNEKEVECYVNKMVYTSKNAKSEQLKDTIMKKRVYYNGFCKYIQMLLMEKNPLIFIEESYESNNYISHEAIWNSLKLINISGLTVDVLDRLQREDLLPEFKLNDHRSGETPVYGSENDINGLDSTFEWDTDCCDEEDDDLNDGNSSNTDDEEDDFIDGKDDEEGAGKESIKFNGKIPDGIPAKDWKRMVKQMNRERRRHKIPKHIKKSFKNKYA